MDIKQRVKDMITNPLETWKTIAYEKTSINYLTNRYLLPLILFGSIATFLGFGFISANSSLQQGFTMAICYFITNIAGIMLVTVTVIKLAPAFTSVADFNDTLKLITYSFTPALAGSIINLLPSLMWLNTIFSIYGIYLLYLGLPLMIKTPGNKQAAFTIIITICTLVIYSLLNTLLAKLLVIGFGISR